MVSLVLFLKAQIKGGAATDLFAERVTVAGHTHGTTFVAPYQADRLKRHEPMILLPQMSGFGYYSYGKGDWYERQWGTTATVNALNDIAKQFNYNSPAASIGIGDISFRFGGRMDPHHTHQGGIHVDLRPCRKDYKLLPVKYSDAEYDQTATKLLIELFLSHKNVKNVLFNDPVIHALRRVIRLFLGGRHG